VSNEEIGAGLGVDPHWITARTGITRRVRAENGTSTADLAVTAGKRALRSGGSEPPDALILSTITPDNRCPATAPEVASRLGLPGIPAFDLAAACTGLLYAAHVAAGLLAVGPAQRVLVIAADRIPTLINPQDRMTAPLFGDAAAAVMIRVGMIDEPGALGPVVLGSDGRDAGLIVAPHDAFMVIRGGPTFQHAVHRMTEVSLQALAGAGWELDEVERFVPHQANARITAAVGRRLGLEAPRVLRHIADVGNTSAASIPLTLARAVSDGRLAPGHRVLLAAFGAGLTWGATTLVWPEIDIAHVSDTDKEDRCSRI
jgi:3-oxoacyl-[acyl-carrier-protein] synthase-3